MKRKNFLVTTAILILAIGVSYSQDNSFPAWGFFGSFNLNDHSYELRELPEVNDTVPRYATGKTNGYTIGALYELPASRKLSLVFRAAFTSNHPEIKGDVPLSDTINTSHTIIANLSSADLEFNLRYKFFSGVSFLLGGSGSLILDNQYSHQVLTDNRLTKIRTTTTENLNGLQTAYKIAVSAGVDYSLAIDMDEKFLLVPEIIYNFGYVSLDNVMHWDVNTLRLGLSIRYAPGRPPVRLRPVETPPVPEKEPEPIIVKKDTIKDIPQKTETKVNIRTMGYDGKNEFSMTGLRVEEFISTNIPPLLNYIFFDHNSDVLPSRYSQLSAREAEIFQIDNLHNLPTLEVYYNIMNIIGRRMHLFPKASITLTGCNSDTSEEKGNQKLSASRAQKIYDYLTGVWKISPSRIKIQIRNLPEKPSNVNTPDGIEENRRVEITSDVWDVVAPVITNRTLLVTDPKTIRFYSDINSDKEISSWNISVTQGSSALKTVTGQGRPQPNVFEWDLGKDFMATPRGSQPLAYSIDLFGRNNEKLASANGSIAVKQVTVMEKHLNKTGDKKIDNYSLILFDFDKSTLNDANKRIIKFINDRLEKSSEIYISGYTDRTGEPDYNLELSRARARSAAGALKGRQMEVNGFGETKLLYDNTLPEGRFYCRTVEIRVETPVK